ncbi:MAG: hypothetical protein AAB459_00525 [Patescibacteria group bacterium]
MTKILKNKFLLLLSCGFLAGVLFLISIRFITFKSENIHYHANFALYIHGKQDEFNSFTFYEEVAACASDSHNNPKNRAHMHNQNASLVHIHAHAVTWGHFLANLGYGVNNDSIKTDNGVFVAEGQNKLSFILNGKIETSLANRLINSQDRLLINFGNDDQKTLMKRFEQIPADAKEFNGKFDPGGCSGGEELTPMQRLKQSFP